MTAAFSVILNAFILVTAKDTLRGELMDRLSCLIGKFRTATGVALISAVGLALVINSALAGEWEETLAAAKKEGVVSIWGPPGTWARKAMIGAFNKRYPNIKVDFRGSSGSRGWPKLARERRVGLYSVDIHVVS